MIIQTAYLNQQAEERTHDVWLGEFDYQVNFNAGKYANYIPSRAANETQPHT